MDHQFVPLSGSQDTGGRYTRCSVFGCTRGPDQHTAAAQPRPEGAPALTDTDIAWYRGNHTAASVKLHDGSDGLECTYCEDSDWPCSILNMVEEIVATRAELAAERRARAKAEAEVGRLRAALSMVREEITHDTDEYNDWCRRDCLACRLDTLAAAPAADPEVCAIHAWPFALSGPCMNCGAEPPTMTGE
jgi:hypothetical protein